MLKLENKKDLILERILKALLFTLALISTVSAKDMTGAMTQSQVKAALESSEVRDTIEMIERVHSSKCSLKSVNSSIGDHFMKYSCKGAKSKLKLILRANTKGDEIALKNYKVFFKK